MTDEEKSELPWWQREYEELLKKYQEETGDYGGLPIDFDRPKPKLSDILRCAHLAKEQPEIWELAKEQALIPLEEWDDDDNRMSNVSWAFDKWFIFKNNLHDQLPFAFGQFSLILREILQPGFDGNIANAARKVLYPSWYIDDLPVGEGGEQ